MTARERETARHRGRLRKRGRGRYSDREGRLKDIEKTQKKTKKWESRPLRLEVACSFDEGSIKWVTEFYCGNRKCSEK